MKKKLFALHYLILLHIHVETGTAIYTAGADKRKL